MDADSPPPPAAKSQLVYGVEDRPALGVAWLVSLQQVAAMAVGVVAPPLLLAGILKFPPEITARLVSMALLAAAAGVLLQTTRLGPIGSGLLSVTGTSFSFMQPMIQCGQSGGLALIMGMTIVSASLSLVFAPVLPRLKWFFTPLVSGVVVLLVGLSLLPKGMSAIVASQGPGAPNWAGPLVAGVVLVVVVATQAVGRPWARLLSMLFGTVAGYALCAACGWLHVPAATGGDWIMVPRLLEYGVAFRGELLLSFVVIYLVLSIEALGVMTATAQLSGLNLESAEHTARLRGGLITDGLAGVIAGLIGTFPGTTYAQNNAVIQITGVASRHLGKWIALLLALLGLFPFVSRVITAMPPAVLGGVASLLFGLVAVSGLRLIFSAGLSHRNALIIALSLAVGLGIPAQTAWLATVPRAISGFLESGIPAGAVVALVLNLVLPESGSAK